MKWIERLREKVHAAQSPLSPRANRQSSEEGGSPRFGFGPFVTRDTNESEQDFKRAWDDFRSAVEKEKEEALEKVLNLFCKISRRSGNPARLAQTLVDNRVFAFVVAKALVTDIEKLRKASPTGQLQPNDILKYFAGELKGDLSVGGNLLFALEGLVTPPLDVQPLLEAGLLSSLVIVLHRLVFSADSASSSMATDILDSPRSTDDSRDENRRVVVEGSVVHVMKALARHPGAAQTLAECHRFQFMFHMVVLGGTTPLMSESQKRDVTSAHLAQLYRHVLQILELLLASDNGATAQYIQTHQLVEALLTPVVYFVSDTGDASYTVSVVSLIKDAVQLSCRSESGGICLKNNLEQGHGYKYLLKLALKLAESARDLPTENQTSDCETIPPQLMRLLDIIGELAQVGTKKVGVHSGSGIAGKAGKPPPGGQLNSKFESTDSLVGVSLDGKIRDSDSVRIFQDLFLQTEVVSLRVELLDRLLRLFASHPDNYGIVRELRKMPLFVQNMGKYPRLLQERVLKVLEYTVISGNCVPEQELLSLCYLVQQPLSSSLRVAVLTFFEKLLSFDRQYKKVLREVGVMDLLLDELKKCEPPVSSSQTSFRSRENPIRASSMGVLQLEREYTSSLNQLIFEDGATVGLAWSCLISLLRKSEGNQVVFRKVNGVAAVLPLLAAPKHRSNVLKLLTCLISEDLSQVHKEEFKALIEAIHTSSVKNLEGRRWRVELETKEDVLWMMWKVLIANPALKIVFGDAHGFSLLLSVLESIQADDQSGTTSLLSGLDESDADSGDGLPSLPRLKLRMELFSALLHVLIAAVTETPKNRNLLHECLLSQNFKRLLSCSGLVCKDFEEKFAELMFDLALERIHSPSQSTQGLPILLQNDQAGHEYFQLPGVHGSFVLDLNQAVEGEEVYNASAIEVLLFCLLQFSLKLQLRVLIRLKSIARASPRNQDALSAVGCVGLLLEAIRLMVPNPSSLLTCSLQVVEILGAFRLSSSEIRTLGRYIWQNRDGSGGQTGKSILETVKRMWSVDFVPESLSFSSFVEFRMSRIGHACIRVPLVDRTWPPAAGYSFVCWIRLENLNSQASMVTEPNGPRSILAGKKLGTTGHILRIFSVCTVEEKATTCVELFMDDSGGLKLVTSPTSSLFFKGVHLEEGRWYHLVIVHNKPNALAGLFQSSVAYLYLNGRLCHTGKLGYAATPIGKSLQVIIGTPAAQAEVCSISWRLGSCYLYEEVLSAPAVFFMYVLGRSYRGLFQDPNLIRFIPQEACGGGNLAVLETLDIEQQSSSVVQRGEGSARGAAGVLKTDGSGAIWDMEKFANIAQLSGRKLIFAFDGTFSNVSVSTAAVTMVNLVDSMSASASLSGGIPRGAELSGDIHICTPLNIADNMRKVGGVAVVLAMVEASKSSEMLHLALSLLHSVLKYNSRNARDMQKCHGYHLLALFLHRRIKYFDKQCLDLLFKIATCQAVVSVKTLPVSEKPAHLQKAMPTQEPIRQISGVPDSITRLVHMDSGIDSGLDVSSNPSKFDDQGSSYGSIFDPAESFGQESSTGPGISDLGVVDTSTDDDDCDVLSNPDLVVHVLLDWTLWSNTPVILQVAVIGFISRLVSMKRYRKYNMTVFRRINLMQHLLVILQRDFQVPVFEAVVELLTMILKDGFLSSELQLVADFVVMTFDPSPSIEGTPIVAREPMSNQVRVRNMLLDKLIDLQFSLKSDEVKAEEWNKVVSSKVVTFLLDDAVHQCSMGRVITLLGLCLATSATFASKFKATGGYQHLARVLPSFFDSPDIYFILFKLIFNLSVYPRQPEVRMLDFHALMPGDGKFGDICFPELLDVLIAMCRAGFNRVSKQSLTAQQSGNFSEFSASLSRSFSGVTEDSGEALQGEALLHKTYAARLMGGEAAAPALITSILRFMVDLAKMCHPFTLACRRMEFLESFVDLYFSCARSAGAVQSAQEALAHSLRSGQGEDLFYPNDSSLIDVNEIGYQKMNGLNDHEVKLEKGFSGELMASAFPEYPMDTINDMLYDTTVEVSDSLPKYDGQAFRPSSPSMAGLESSPRWGQGDSPTASEVSSSVVTPKVQNVGSPVGSFLGAPHEAFSRLRTLSSLAGPLISRSEGDSSSRHRSSAFFSSTPLTPRSEADSFYSDFGAASSGRFSANGASPDANVTSKLLLQLESMGSAGGSCAAGAAAILDLIAEVLADTLTEHPKGMSVVEAAVEAVPLYVGSDTMLVFQGLCLDRMINYLERRLLRDEEEHLKKLDKNRWAPNLDTLSWLLVDRAFMGAFANPGAPIKVLEFLFAMLQLANSDGRVEEAVPAGKGLLALARGGGRQVEPYVQALLKNTNRMIMFCLLPPSSAGGLGEDSLPSSFRRNSDSLLRSLDSLRHGAEGGLGEFGVSSQEIDKATVLQLILANKKLIFCASNVDPELLCALCVNVTPLLWDPEPSTRSLAVDVWRALVLHRSPALEDILIWRGTQGAANVDVLHDGFNLLLTVGFKDFYAWIEDSWGTVRKVLEQRAAVVWKEYVQGASRFSGVRIKPLEGRRKREMTRRLRDTSRIDHSHREQVAKSRSGLEQVRESIIAELQMLRQDKYGWILHAEREWEKHIQQLVHERGLWPMASATAGGKSIWQLCTKEGPFRMRKKLERQKINQTDIYDTSLEGEDTPGLEYLRRWSLGREGTPPSLSADHPDFKMHLRVHSKDFYALSIDDEDDQSKAEGVDDDDCSSAQGQLSDDQPSSLIQDNQVPDRMQSEEGSHPGVREDPEFLDDTEDIGDAQNMEIDVHEDGEYLIRPFLEPGEKLKYRYNCERVIGLDKRDGIFLIGEHCLYVIDNYYIDEEGCIKEKGDEGDISVIDRALGVPMGGSNDSQDGMKLQSSGSIGETVPVSWPGGRAWAFSGGAWGKEKVRAGPNMGHTWHMWKLESVHELLKRQYQLRPVAIELFSMNGVNELLVFHMNERDEVFKNLLAQNLPRNSMLDTTISGATKQEGNEGGRLFKMLAKSFSKRWQNGEISNFQYLMHLNTLAGRGYNDLTQYPVFPWILADYESQELDLSKPETFRCLEKPMGAQHPTREEAFKTRYENWDDSDIPRFHYGSHYSSAGIVLFYLIRLPPFSWENKKLQGGEFDHADRLFSSLHDTWLSASQGNTADVKELIPEFYYLPEFLENLCEFDLGMTQSGEKVDHVQLPPWAKGSAREFIRKHREALESQYVSENLHHWIDLIFGFKQRGKAAVEATNVFYYLTYDGAVNIDSVHDPAMKAAILAQINHFGQTPRQLFPKPHPKRRWVPKPALALVPYTNHTVVPQEVRTMGSRVSQIVLYQNTPYIAIANRVLRPPSYDRYVAWGFPDRSLRFMSFDKDLVLSTHENLHDDGPVTCAGFSMDGQILVTGGEDGVVAVWRFTVPISNSSPLHLQRALCAHTQAVTCLAVSQSYSLVVSASKDRTVIFWDLTSLEYVRQLPELPASATALHINDMTGEVVTAVGSILTVWSINGDCLAAVNTSQAYSDTILSITSPQVSDWTEAGWYLSGHHSGVIQLWRMQFDSYSSTNRMSLLRAKSGDPFATPVKPGSRPRNTWIALPASSGLRRFKSGVESTEDPTKACITGGTPEFQLVAIKELSWHKEPVTALCLGNDLKQLCSGDSGGHVVSWTLLDDVSKNPPLLGSQLDICTSCQTQVSASEKRHYCRNCGYVLCSDCSDTHQLKLEDLGHFLPVRVCARCFQTRKINEPLASEGPMEQVATEGPYLSNSASYNRSDSSKF